MSMSNYAEPTIVSGGDGGRSTANLNYILYIVGFFFPITALIGVIVAYVNRSASPEPSRSHFNWQIKIFWRGVMISAASLLLIPVIGAIAMATHGIGLVLEVVPIGLGIWWLVWTIIAIGRGMGALSRDETMGRS